VSAPGVLRRDELVERNSILYRDDDDSLSAYRSRWEAEAAADPVRSATAATLPGEADLAALTRKTSPLWQRFPEGRHFGTVLEIGTGYGRIPLYLAKVRRCTWSSYYAVDISENMLRELLRHQERFAVNPAARLYPICISADTLPLEDDTVDLAIASAVFLHMGKSFVRRAVAEIARTLKPGGQVAFDVAFPNARNPANAPSRLKPRRLRPPNFMKYWAREEVEELLVETGLEAKAGPLTVAPGGYTLIPKRLGPLPVPLARRINAAVGVPGPRLRDRLATTYDVYSSRTFDE
jgi:SAM-dependent methyltransferase